MRAVGFDIGGTILNYVEIPLDWSAHYRAAIETVGAGCNARLSERLIEAARTALQLHNTRIHPRRAEVSDGEVIADLLRALGLDHAVNSEAAADAFFGYFRQSLRAYPEARDVLSALLARGLRIGALTDVPYGMPRAFVERDLQDTNLAGMIPALVTSVEVGWRKPEPIGYERLAHELGVDASQLVYVGNERKDVEGAIAAGATAVLIDRDGATPAWGQEHTIRDLRELLALPGLDLASR